MLFNIKNMLFNIKNMSAALALVLFAAASAIAGETASEINQRKGNGDPVLGKEKSALCQGCHGVDGNSLSPQFPKLAGQWADYIQKQVRNFQSQSRINVTMNEIAMNVRDFEDLYDIAAYFASQKTMGGSQITEPSSDKPEYANFLKGQKIFMEGDPENGVFRCVLCHGLYGKGEPLNNNLFPVIGGQYKEYIVKQLKEFKSGFRKNDHSGMMPRITSNMTEEQMEAVATYLDPGVFAPKPVAKIARAPVPDALKTLAEAKTVSIEGTNFESGSATLKETASQQLNKVAEFAEQNSNAALEVTGHTDIVGSVDLNIALSFARAEAVKKYLVDKGVAEGRIITHGKGSDVPVADNQTEEGRAKNRRVEIRAVTKQPTVPNVTPATQ
jgi:outer membrane protein OmpA-like peptidoglycan-associated protein